MRVGPYTGNTSRPTAGQTSGTETELPALALARRIKAEQGSIYAGYFLNAIRPYVAPAEIIRIERALDIHAEYDPRVFQPQQSPQRNSDNKPKEASGKPDMAMLQMLMSLMGNKKTGSDSVGSNGSVDPSMLMKLFNK